MKKIIYITLCLYSTLFLSQTKAKVVGIKDGDTLLVLLIDNKQEVLRLADVDCPESGQPFGKNAKQFTSSQVFGKNIEFYEISKDRYGRTIAKIFYEDNKYLSEEIIKAGYGWWYYKYSKNKELEKYQNIAREQKLGLWSEENVVTPWEYRKLKNTLEYQHSE